MSSNFFKLKNFNIFAVRKLTFLWEEGPLTPRERKRLTLAKEFAARQSSVTETTQLSSRNEACANSGHERFDETGNLTGARFHAA